jgi:UDP-N-acetylglucosamine 3-dehydrogenase
VITVAVVGAGFMGSAHTANYKALDGRVRVKTVVSRSLDRAMKVAETVGAEASTDLEDVLRDPEIDAVDVCIPTPAHRDAAERALAAGKHVFLEKPIALTLEDADAILRAAAASQRLFMVGLVLRFWPEYVELQRRVAAGQIGRVSAVATRRLSPPADWAEWFADRAQTGGTAVDLLVHDFDQMNWLLGSPRSVLAHEPVPGHVHALVEYEGASALAEGSMAMPRSYPFSSSIRVQGETGAAEYTFSAAPAEGGGNIGEATGPPGLRLYPGEGEPVTVPVESADPWGPEIAYFVECIELGRAPEQGTGEQAREALLVSLAANRSLASGRSEAV